MNRLPRDKKKLSSRGQPIRKHNVLYVVRLKGNESSSFCLYCRKGVDYLTHWTEVGTVPCFADGSCKGGCKPATVRQNWLLHAWEIQGQREVFLYLTPTAYESLLEQLGPEGDMRGRVVIVKRTASKKGRLVIELSQHAARDPASLPPVRDAYESIMNFLGLDPAGEDNGSRPALRSSPPSRPQTVIPSPRTASKPL